jgi:hypothetical protein
MITYETTLPRAALGLIAGSIAGALLVTLFEIVNAFDYYRQYGTQTGAAMIVFTYALIVWTAGLFLVAPLPWFALHRRGIRGWRAAILFGILLSFIGALGFFTNGFGLNPNGGAFSASDSGGPIWIDGHLTLHGWIEAAKAALLCSIGGALVALAVWRTAYRRAPSP